MRRIDVAPREGWQDIAKAEGFLFHLTDGRPYWDESAAIALTLEQVERDIEAPTDELNAMCMELVSVAVESERMMERLGIPAEHRDFVADSWYRHDPSILGRMDLAYDGKGPAKLLEFNADTPTSLYEAAVFQWKWLEDGIAKGFLPKGADQFNSIHERLIAAYAKVPNDSILHFTCDAENAEDYGTVAYMMDCALQAGHRPKFLDLTQIGVDALGRFSDQDDLVIDRLSKLDPWEFLFRDDYAKHLVSSGATFLEPAWKALLSTKAILPLLWELHRGHPNLLPAFFEDDEKAASLTSYARKPIFSREGANTTLVRDGKVVDETDGGYGEEGYVRQQATELFSGPRGHVVVGSWIVDGQACGMGIREGAKAITRNDSRFIPHVIVDEEWKGYEAPAGAPRAPLPPFPTMPIG